MKRKYMNFSLLGNGNSRCYRVSEESDGANISDNTNEQVSSDVVDNDNDNVDIPVKEEKKEEIKPFDSDAFRGKKKKGKTAPILDEVINSDNIDDSNNTPNKEEVIGETKDTQKETVTTKEQVYKYNPVWDILKKNLSDDDNKWDLPEEIKTGKKKDGSVLTAEEEFDLLKDTFIDNTDFTDGDPFISEYIEAKEKGLSADEFLKTKVSSFIDNSKLSTRDKAIQSYKNYRDDNKDSLKDSEGNWIDGWSDDDINDEVDDLKPIQLKKVADEYDNNVKEREQKKIRQDIENYNKNTEKIYYKLEKENEQLIDRYLKNIEGKNTISGIEFGEAEMAQYRKELPTFMKRQLKTDEKTGLKFYISPAEELLRDVLSKTEDTFELLPYLFMVKNKTLKGYTTRIKERIKESLEKTLDDVPTQVTGTARVGGFNAKRFREGKF